MIDRQLEQTDLAELQISMDKDGCHKGINVETFLQPNTVSRVVEDETSSILVYKCSKTLRLDTQFLDNTDVRRNRDAILETFPKVLELAKVNGFNEIIFQTANPILKRFMSKHFQFEESVGEMVRKVG